MCLHAYLPALLKCMHTCMPMYLFACLWPPLLMPLSLRAQLRTALLAPACVHAKSQDRADRRWQDKALAEADLAEAKLLDDVDDQVKPCLLNGLCGASSAAVLGQALQAVYQPR